MTSLSPPFILCPLPDRQSLLGIRPDRLPNKAIVTLGKNIAIRYHTLEQKQESSWTTSRFWFTSPVTYCYDLGKYGAILNNNTVALWDEGDSTLSNITKLKLPENALDLYTNASGRTVVVMKGGRAAFFSDVSADKSIVKGAVFHDPKETIVSFDVNESHNQAYLITKKEPASKKYSVVLTSIEQGSKAFISRLTIGNDSNEVLGFCVLDSGSETWIVYVCADGHIYRRNIRGNRGESEPMKLANLTKYLNNSNPVVLRPLENNSSVAIYGCDASEEGATILIYDIHYDVVVSKQPLKLYSNPPMMEEIGNSLFVPLGMHILVLNCKTDKSLLSAVTGKHQAKLDEEVFEGRNPWITEGWKVDDGTTSETMEEEPEDLKHLKEAYPLEWEIVQQVKLLESEGHPEAVICNHVIPAALEKKNMAALDWILNTFLDIPEVHIVSLVVFSLNEVTTSKDGVSTESDRLNQLLVRKFDRNLLTLSLRHISYEDAKALIMYINSQIKNQWQLDIDEVEEGYSMKSWLKWCSCLVDAHYTKFVLHNDTAAIDSLLESVSECTNVMKTVEELEPFLVMTYSKTSFEPSVDRLTRWRTESVTFV